MNKKFWLFVSCLTVLFMMLIFPGATLAKTPQYGGTLRYMASWIGGMASWDFPGKWNGGNEAVLTISNDSLMNGDWERGPGGTGEFGFSHYYMIPGEFATCYLCESYELVNPMKIVFKLKKGIKWHNKHPTWGRELVASDLVFAYEHIAKARHPTHDYIKKLSAPDKHTFVVEFKTPIPFWRYEIGYGPYLLVIAPETVKEGIADWKNHAGTGAFMVDDFKAGTSITFKRNPDYWGTWKYQGKEYKLPFADKLVFPLIKDKSTQLAAIQTGKIDAGTSLPAKHKKRLIKGAPELKFKTFWSGSTTLVSFRFDRPDLPTHDLRVRQALNMAIDRQGIVDAVFGGEAVVEMRPFGENSVVPAVKDAPEEFAMLYEYNPKRAKQLLAEAGYPNGFEIGFLYHGSEDNTALAEMIEYYWKQVGVRTKLDPQDRGTGFGMLSKRQYDIVMWGHDGCLTTYWSPKEADEDVWMNTSEFHDKWFHETWMKAKQEMDDEKRNAMVKEIIMYFHKKAPKVCFPNVNVLNFWHPWVHNYHGEHNLGFLDWGFTRYMWIDRDMRAQKIGFRD